MPARTMLVHSGLVPSVLAHSELGHSALAMCAWLG